MTPQRFLFSNNLVKTNIGVGQFAISNASNIKSLLSLKLTEIDNNLLKGGDEYIEFMRLAYDFSKIINIK